MTPFFEVLDRMSTDAFYATVGVFLIIVAVTHYFVSRRRP